jgi:hypothetical protein
MERPTSVSASHPITPSSHMQLHPTSQYLKHLYLQDPVCISLGFHLVWAALAFPSPPRRREGKSHQFLPPTPLCYSRTLASISLCLAYSGNLFVPSFLLPCRHIVGGSEHTTLRPIAQQKTRPSALLSGGIIPRTRSTGDLITHTSPFRFLAFSGSSPVDPHANPYTSAGMWLTS